MKQFPAALGIKKDEKTVLDACHVTNRLKRKYFETTFIPLVREKVYTHICLHSQEDYVNYFDFITEGITIQDVRKAMVPIIQELKNLGWSAESTFGDTALYIYSTTTPPKSFVKENDCANI